MAKQPTMRDNEKLKADALAKQRAKEAAAAKALARSAEIEKPLNEGVSDAESATGADAGASGGVLGEGTDGGAVDGRDAGDGRTDAGGAVGDVGAGADGATAGAEGVEPTVEEKVESDAAEAKDGQSVEGRLSRVEAQVLAVEIVVRSVVRSLAEESGKGAIVRGHVGHIDDLPKVENLKF